MNDDLFLPTLNACLNSTSALLLIIGYACVRMKKITAHKAFMLAACVTSALFLVCYLIHHARIGSRPFEGEGWIRTVYFIVLIPHVILAAVNLPFIIAMLRFAFRGEFERHARLARWVFPSWLYVSVTGVIVYLMLYRF